MRIGWASWDNGSYTARSIKYAYPDGSGKISRGSPELPFDILIDMVMLATDQKEVKFEPPSLKAMDLENASVEELGKERQLLAAALMRLSQLAMEVPWADWAKVYDPIGVQYEAVKAKLMARKTAS